MNDRVLHVPRRFATDEWGGTESVVFNLCVQQQARGLRPEIHTSRALAPVAREIWRDIPIRRHRHVYPFFGLNDTEIRALDKKGGNLLSLDLFGSLLAARNVRIYHAHVLKRMGGSVLTAARLRGRPCVVTLHGNVFDVPEEEAASIVEAQQGHFEWGKPFGALFRSRQLLDEADAVLCVGHSEYEAAKKALSHDRIHHLANGVNPESFEDGDADAGRRALGWPPEAIGFGCLSRIDPQKNQLLLVRAFAELVRARPQDDLRLLIGGPVTSPDYLREIGDAIREEGIGRFVSFHEAVEAESRKHRDLLAALDAFVLPSRHEPFGIVVLEAWASGLPVVVSDVGGLKRLVSDGSDGLRFPSGDSTALAAAMGRIASAPALRRSLAEAGRETMLRNYTWRAVNDRLEDIYQAAEARQR
ncbi:MAG: glycosyltransferase family 4 protein [Verrucomicrobiae bacterium]|nr:glycosyltransferase family 4 protein [Verrucomicrobiae bacterium]